MGRVSRAHGGACWARRLGAILARHRSRLRAVRLACCLARGGDPRAEAALHQLARTMLAGHCAKTRAHARQGNPPPPPPGAQRGLSAMVGGFTEGSCLDDFSSGASQLHMPQKAHGPPHPHMQPVNRYKPALPPTHLRSFSPPTCR